MKLSSQWNFGKKMSWKPQASHAAPRIVSTSWKSGWLKAYTQHVTFMCLQNPALPKLPPYLWTHQHVHGLQGSTEAELSHPSTHYLAWVSCASWLIHQYYTPSSCWHHVFTPRFPNSCQVYATGVFEQAMRFFRDATCWNWRVYTLFWLNWFHYIFLHKTDYLMSCTN